MLTREHRDKLIRLLEACGAIRDPHQRAAIVERLESVRPHVAYAPQLRAHLTSIVEVCARNGVVRLLLDSVRHFEGESVAMAACEQWYQSVSEHDVADPQLASSSSPTRVRVVVALGLGVTALALVGAGYYLFWPPLRMDRFAQEPGIVVVQRRGDDRTAGDHLCQLLRARGEQAVQCIETRRFGHEDQELVRTAARVGASLVAIVRADARLTIAPIPGRPGSVLLEGLPDVGMAAPETRVRLAEILYLLAHASSDVAAPIDGDIDIPYPEKLSWRITALAALVRHLAGRGDWSESDIAALNAAIRQCDREGGPIDNHCAAAMLVLAWQSPENSELVRRDYISSLAERNRGMLGQLAAFLLSAGDCHDAARLGPAQVLNLADRWPPCERLSLMRVATCFLEETDISDAQVQTSLTALARPEADSYRTCPRTSTATYFASRAYFHFTREHWSAAAADYLQAYRVYRGEPGYLLSWAESLLRMNPRPPDIGARITAELRADNHFGRNRVQALLFLWLATEQTEYARALCAAYDDQIKDGQAALTHVPWPLMCEKDPDGPGPHSRHCLIYRALTANKDADRRATLRTLLCTDEPLPAGPLLESGP